MRYIHGALLIVFLALVLIFAVQNINNATLQFLGWTIELPLAALIVVSYLLGMVSGWSVVSFLRQTYRKVREHEHG